ncbi:inositol monophosphatase 3-like [Gigantopelta aegis]|uniref:inositol monophosphatase 3-like n=1 Tax=Gigantopelta aegis TaxID=1735272 RepID=UPI001B88C280|nr:inositol monophosphatase 3-like [Gigantopelta aegis]
MAPVNVRLNRFGVVIFVLATLCILFYLFGLPWFFPGEPRVSMKELLSVSIVLAQRGGKIVRDIAINNNRTLDTKQKGLTREGKKELVTRSDVESHKAIYYGFAKAYPGMQVISEEHDTEPISLSAIPEVTKKLEEVENIIKSDQSIAMKSISVWVDPLDATQEYTEGLYKYITTMVCIVVNGEPTIGVIHRPFEGDTVWAWVGYGHSANIEKAAKKPEGHQKIIVSRSHEGTVASVVQKAFGDAEIIHAGGSGYKTLEVLRGNADAYIHVTQIKKWDICSGNAILSALDGKMTTLEGNYLNYSPRLDVKNDKGLLATIHNHHQFLEHLEPAAEDLKKNTKTKS